MKLLINDFEQNVHKNEYDRFHHFIFCIYQPRTIVYDVFFLNFRVGCKENQQK